MMCFYFSDFVLLVSVVIGFLTVAGYSGDF